MGRPLRVKQADWIFHALNRANSRQRIFRSERDYAAFERVLETACERVPMRVLAYVVMPNHWHFVLWPQNEGDLSRFVGWLTLTHTQRWHAHHQTTGSGHLYQGRFKSFPVSSDLHFLKVCRYVERNPLRAGLVERAEDWRWGSLWRRQSGDSRDGRLLSEWPVPRPHDWLDEVNRPQPGTELEEVRLSVQRGRPFGDPAWTVRAARSLGLESTLRSRGRPLRRAGLRAEKGS